MGAALSLKIVRECSETEADSQPTAAKVKVAVPRTRITPKVSQTSAGANIATPGTGAPPTERGRKKANVGQHSHREVKPHKRCRSGKKQRVATKPKEAAAGWAANGAADGRLGKRVYSATVGKAASTVDEHAMLYGVPCLGPRIDPLEVCRWVHRWLADNARALQRFRSGDEEESRAEAERRKAIAVAGREELRLARERGEVVDRIEAEKRRLELVRWMAAVFERSAVDIYATIAPLEKHEIKEAVDAYFDRLRQEIIGNK